MLQGKKQYSKNSKGRLKEWQSAIVPILGASVGGAYLVYMFLRDSDYLGFGDYRQIFVLLAFLAMIVLYQVFTIKYSEPFNREEHREDIERWQIRNLSRYEVYSLVAIMIYFVPFDGLFHAYNFDLEAYRSNIEMVKRLGCMLFVIWASRKSVKLRMMLKRQSK
ncbi:hypothetical protein [Photobacterium sanguinicancri]|uniref:hypothetical protein n=1 Tax=Photobacterium sanguinicancri TaxID=875932 RepID=UPI003D0CD7EC